MAKKSSSHVGIITAAAIAAAGAYFLYGSKEAAKNRKKVTGWALKAKGEVLHKMESLKEVNEEVYEKVVDGVLKRYQTLKTVEPKEVMALTKELKGHWKNIQKELVTGKSKVAKTAAKVVKDIKNPPAK